jgi:hypothetical protein
MIAHCKACPHPDCLDSCPVWRERDRKERPKISRREYMRLYMIRYREKHDSRLQEYYRDYRRKKRAEKSGIKPLTKDIRMC